MQCGFLFTTNGAQRRASGRKCCSARNTLKRDGRASFAAADAAPAACGPRPDKPACGFDALRIAARATDLSQPFVKIAVGLLFLRGTIGSRVCVMCGKDVFGIVLAAGRSTRFDFSISCAQQAAPAAVRG
jgi:hypothetical protein